MKALSRWFFLVTIASVFALFPLQAQQREGGNKGDRHQSEQGFKGDRHDGNFGGNRFDKGDGWRDNHDGRDRDRDRDRDRHRDGCDKPVEPPVVYTVSASTDGFTAISGPTSVEAGTDGIWTITTLPAFGPLPIHVLVNGVEVYSGFLMDSYVLTLTVTGDLEIFVMAEVTIVG